MSRIMRAGLLSICLFLCPLLGAQSTAQKLRLVVTVPVADMHSSPTEDSDVVSQAIFGATVEVIEEKASWDKVRTTDQYTGWMPLDSARPLADSEPAYASQTRAVQVTSLFATLYREPDVTAHQPLLILPFETRLEVAEESADEPSWLRVRLPDDRSAWLQRGDVTFNPKRLSIPESIALAKRFMGFPYHWGGTSSFGYDCSGFTQMLVHSRGIIMPRDADLQAAWSGVIAIDRKDLQPGDLLFFGSSPEKIGHTGMYIGNGEFIHSTTHDHPVVQISRLDDQPWTRILVACGRVK